MSKKSKPMKVSAPDRSNEPEATELPSFTPDDPDVMTSAAVVDPFVEKSLEHLRVYVEMLGMRARDRVTGYQGVVASVSFDLFGCVQFVLRPPVDKEGKLPDAHWFDANRVIVMDTMRVMPVPAFAHSPELHDHGPSEKPARAI